MRLFLGTLIGLISMLIIALNFWYYHYHMVVFGRGLLEALPSERMVAFVFTSIAFMTSFYLALRHLIFEGNDKKRAWVKKKWTLTEIAGVFACLAIFWLPMSHLVISFYYIISQEGSKSACLRMESDAQNTAATIADYFAEPENIALPSADQLVKEFDLNTDFPVKIKEDANGLPIITVIDDKAECRKGEKYVFYMGGAASEWEN